MKGRCECIKAGAEEEKGKKRKKRKGEIWREKERAGTEGIVEGRKQGRNMRMQGGNTRT